MTRVFSYSNNSQTPLKAILQRYKKKKFKIIKETSCVCEILIAIFADLADDLHLCTRETVLTTRNTHRKYEHFIIYHSKLWPMLKFFEDKQRNR